MNMKEWMESGIIEAYILGDLSEVEVREVEDMAQRYPDVQKEINETEMTLEGLAMKTAISPGQDIKDRIFQQLGQRTEEITLPDESATSKSEEASTKEYTIAPERTQTVKLWKYWSAAASLLLVGATVLAIYYRQQWHSTESELEDYLTENQNITQEYQALRSDYEQLQGQQEIFANPSFTQVKLNAIDTSSSYYAVIYWNAESEEVYLNPAGLPAPESGKQYQLWAIVDGKPQNAGIFDIENQLLDMQQIQNASAFAITLEPEGGSENPTMEAMYVLGEV